MEDKLNEILLYETYKNVLTENMQNIFEQYYYSDLSLREIGENNNISFQAVRDTLKKTEKILKSHEEKIGMLALKMKITKLNEYLSNENMDIELMKNKIKELGE